MKADEIFEKLKYDKINVVDMKDAYAYISRV